MLLGCCCSRGSAGGWEELLPPCCSQPWHHCLPHLAHLPLPGPALQADRRALNITLNSIGTELTRDDRRRLYADFGLLYPHGQNELAVAEDFDQIRSAMEKVPPYQAIFHRVRCRSWAAGVGRPCLGCWPGRAVWFKRVAVSSAGLR